MKSFGVGLIAKKDIGKRPCRKFMWSGSGDVGVTQATKDLEIVIGWRRPEQKMMRGIVPAWFARTDVEKESGGGESIGPKARRHVCMKEQSMDTLIEGAENTFGTSVLL